MLCCTCSRHTRWKRTLYPIREHNRSRRAAAGADTIEKTMTEDEQRRRRKRRRLWLALAVLVALLAVLIVPPFLSVSRYKSRITSLMAASLGRPVRLSSVRVRLLPRPGFVLYDLTVDEKPEFGAEPLLHANAVTASIRLLSLWRGRLEISEVSVDEASLNLVRSPEGSWNLESLFQTAATKTGPCESRRKSVRAAFRIIAATNSRINFKNGVEKLPFSVVNADLSFWQENPGEWRIRLRGQPARTDVSLNQADTGDCGTGGKRAAGGRFAPYACPSGPGLARRSAWPTYATCDGLRRRVARRSAGRSASGRDGRGCANQDQVASQRSSPGRVCSGGVDGF